MKKYTTTDYANIISGKIQLPNEIQIDDHLGGFDSTYRNVLLDSISKKAQDKKITVFTEYLFDNKIKDNYTNLQLRFNVNLLDRFINQLQNYNIHPPVNFENFACSFNGSAHVSRKLLVGAMNRFKMFSKYSTKNFAYETDTLDGHIDELCANPDFYRKFFISDDNFGEKIFSIDYERFDHGNNIKVLAPIITKNFIHIVSESLATSNYPFFGEKNFYSIVTRGLWLSYGPPEYHTMFSRYFGFKLYDNIFDYSFDKITNPIERLISLLTMLLKFTNLSFSDLHDLYLQEQNTVEFNYDHYFSGNYYTNLKRFTENEI